MQLKNISLFFYSNTQNTYTEEYSKSSWEMRSIKVYMDSKNILNLTFQELFDVCTLKYCTHPWPKKEKSKRKKRRRKLKSV